jgi:FMN phosphatase YigB (HAD superfamily)
MIGDSWRADVQGALEMGMRAILVRAQHSDSTVQCGSVMEVATIVERS